MIITQFQARIDGSQQYFRPDLPSDLSGNDQDYSAIWFAADILAANSSNYGETSNYTAYAIKPTVSGTYTFTIDSASGMQDTQLWLYSDSFDPQHPLVNVVAANEDIDYMPGIGTVNMLSHLPDMQLTAGHTYVLVVNSRGDIGNVNFSADGAGSLAPDTTAPAIVSVGVPAPGTYIVGDHLGFTVHFNETVIVDTANGTPTLALQIGAQTVQAEYVGKASDTALTFRYTVTAGQLDANGITIDGTLSANGGTLRDAAGNDALLAIHSAGSTADVLVEAVAPSVAGNIAVPANGTYKTGDTLSFTVAFDENVTVTGTGSTLALTIGGAARSAAFASKTANSVTYTYTVQAGDADADGIAVGSIAAASTIRDASGNDAQLALAGHVPTTAGILVDAVAPFVQSITVGQATSTSVAYTVALSEDAVGVDVADFTLATTGSASGSVASLTAIDGKTYTVTVGNLAGEGTLRLDLNAGGIADTHGNVNVAGFTAGQAYTIDRVAPVVASVAVPADGTYTAGQALDFTVSFSEAVTVDATGGLPRIALVIGDRTVYADYVSGSGTGALTFRHTLAAGHADANGIAVGTLSLDGGTIKDAAGNAALVALNNVGTTAGVLVDSVAPSVSGTVAVPADGAYKAGDTLSFTVAFDENVTVTGTDSTLALTIGGAARSAAFASRTANSVTYTYTVQAGDADTDGIAVGAIDAGTGTIRDAGGNDAQLALAGHLPATAGILVDGVAPFVQSITVGQATSTSVAYTVALSEDAVGVDAADFTLATTGSASGSVALLTAIDGKTYTVTVGNLAGEGTLRLDLNAGGIADTHGNVNVAGFTAGQAYTIDRVAPVVASVAVPADGTYTAGQALDFTVSFSEAVTVDATGGVPRIALVIGDRTVYADYVSGSGTGALTFRHTLAAGHADANGIAVGTLSLDGGTIKDAAGNAALVALNNVGTTAGVLVDSVAPSVSGAVAVPADATYKTGDTLSFTVAFDENVTVTGTDSTLALTIGGIARSAAFLSASGNTVTYTYTVQAGDADADGIAVGAIDAGTGTIRDAGGNDAQLALAGHVPTTAGILVDAVAPVFVGATVNERTLVMTYGDTNALDAIHVPAVGAFTVLAGGNAVTVTAVAVDAAAHTVTLTLATAVRSGQAVTVAYADPAGDDTDAIQDAAGNDAAGLAATAVVNNTRPPVVTPPGTSGTVDGVIVRTDIVTNSDGSISRVVTIPVVVAGRVDEVGGNDVADIALVSNAAGTSLLSVQVPVGVGLQATGPAAPAAAATALADLVREIKAHTDAGSADQALLTGGGSGFAGAIDGATQLLVQTIVPTVAAGGAADGLVLTGTPAAAGNPATALVIDARTLPSGSTIGLEQVDFAALIGAVRVRGGSGAQVVWGDSAAQDIMLGEGDDVLHGGAGDDIVGSAGGNDLVFGDEGNDIVFGGTGNDTIDGGIGHDIVRLEGAGRVAYSLRIVDGSLVMTHADGGVDGTDVVSNVETLRFMSADTSVAGSAGRLVEALAGEHARAAIVDAMVEMAGQGATLSQVAHALYAHYGNSAAPDDEAFVRQLYVNVLDRAADSGGLAWWTGQLANGMARADVALAFADSAEKLALPADVDVAATDVATLVRMYGALYDRAPDEAGLNYWIGAHEGGVSIAAIADAFANGAESAGQHAGDAEFVRALYRDALHRAGATDEVRYWTDLLADGHLDRGDVLLAFADSAEMVALVGTMSTSIATV